MIKCPICKKENPQSIDFCRHCRYPISIKKIDELSKEDLLVSLSSFLEVIGKKRKLLFKDKELEQVYDELLALNWLRPESALFRFIETKILLGLKDKYLKYPTLDLGCGDGLFTAILFGARLNKNYDAYQSVDFKQKDIYNSYTKLPDDFLEKKPLKIGFGIDIKEKAAAKAKELNVYDEVKAGDIRELPFENGSVNSVFSNMINDIKEEDLGPVFKEANRVLKKGGYFIFTSPTPRFKEFLFYYNKNKKELDRGRSKWQGRQLPFWKKLFKENSFQLIEYIEYGDVDMVQFWDTGFRPFFHYLMALRNILKKNDIYLSVKNVFLEIFREYLFKYTKGQISQKGAFSMIVAKKIN